MCGNKIYLWTWNQFNVANFFCFLKQVPVKGAPVQSSPRSRQPIVHSGKFLKKSAIQRILPIFSRVLHRSFYEDWTVYTEYIIYDIYVLILLVPLEYAAVKHIIIVLMILWKLFLYQTWVSIYLAYFWMWRFLHIWIAFSNELDLGEPAFRKKKCCKEYKAKCMKFTVFHWINLIHTFSEIYHVRQECLNIDMENIVNMF